MRSIMSRIALPVLGLAGFLFCASDAHAQLGISLKGKHRKYLRYEPVEVTVTLRNYSGNTLVFGGDGPEQGSLDFVIDSHANVPVAQIPNAPSPVRDLILGAGETRELTLNLNQMYDLQREGAYTVIGQIGHRRLPNDYQSNPINIEVNEGLPVLTRHVGLPSSSAGDTIQSLKVSLVLFHDEDRPMYCLRVEDNRFVYGTFRLGPQIGSSRPQLDADAASDIHVLFQTDPRLYSYSVFSVAERQVRLRQQRFYMSDRGIPELSRQPGYLKVINARPAVEGVDYNLPPPE